jgi:hypothetical protein
VVNGVAERFASGPDVENKGVAVSLCRSQDLAKAVDGINQGFAMALDLRQSVHKNTLDDRGEVVERGLLRYRDLCPITQPTTIGSGHHQSPAHHHLVMYRARIRVLFAMAAAFVLVGSRGVAADPPVKEADTKTKDEGDVLVASRQVFPLKFAKAKDLATLITKHFAAPRTETRFQYGGGLVESRSEAQRAGSKVVASADDQNNLLIFSATEEILREVSKIVAKLDIGIPETGETRIFWLKHGESTELAEVLKGLYGDANSSIKNKVVAVADAPTNSLIVAAERETMAEIAEVVGRWDAIYAKRGRVFVGSRADPDSVAAVLRGMLGDESVPSSPARPSPTSFRGDIITPLEKGRLVIPPSDRVREHSHP